MTRSLSPFGETYFPARDQNNNEVLLAVSRLCIGWYIDGILEEKFSIDRIRRWMAIPEKQLFQMEIDRGYSELHVLGMVLFYFLKSWSNLLSQIIIQDSANQGLREKLPD